MDKLRMIIVKAVDFGKLPKGFSLYMMQELIRIHKDLISNRESVFLVKEIKDLLEDCNIETREYGVGYSTYL